MTAARAAADERIRALESERDEAMSAAEQRVRELQSERDRAIAGADGVDERIRVLEAERDDHARHAEQLASERHDLARRAEQLVALLSPTEALAELAQDLGHARVQAESLRTAAASAPAPPPGRDAPGTTESATVAGDQEPATDAPLDDEALARLSRAAEARAREQAEHELRQAVADGRRTAG
jgi:DNA repair exonuclease SbcCD ATPase subunit